MKNSFLILGALLLTQTTFAAERILLNDSKILAAEVSTNTVRCTAIGYSMPELKINLRGLDGWTLFDHSNLRQGDLAGEPCMTAGMCDQFGDGQGFKIDDLIKGQPGTETIKVERKVIETKEIQKQSLNEGSGNVCVRSVREELHTVVRGIEFNHSRGGLREVFPVKACQH